MARGPDLEGLERDLIRAVGTARDLLRRARGRRREVLRVVEERLMALLPLVSAPEEGAESEEDGEE